MQERASERRPAPLIAWQRWTGVVAVCVILALVVLFFWEGVLAGRVLLLRDIFSLFRPWTAFTMESVSRGVLPLWNPFSFAGQPYAANPQIQLYYPPQVIFLILPYARALSVWMVLHGALFGIGGWWLMRRFGFPHTAAILTATVLVFNGWSIRSQEFLTQYACLCWTPLVMGLWWRVLERRGAGWMVVFAVVLALQVLAGHPQRQVYVWLMLLVAWAVEVVAAVGADGRLRPAALGRPAVALALALALSGVQLLPMVELSWYVVRMDTPFTFSLWPSELVNFVVPYFYGYPDWQKACYVSLAALAIAPFALGLLVSRGRAPEQKDMHERRRRLVLAAVMWFAVGVFLAFGKLNPLLAWIPGDLPYWRELMRWPTASFSMVTFALAVLSGAGVERVMCARRNARVTACGFLAFLCVLALVDVLWGFRFSDVMRHPSRHAQLVQVNPWIEMSRFPVWPHYVRLWGFGGAACVLLGLWRRAGRVAPVAALALIAADLFVFSFKQNFYTSESTIYDESPSRIHELAEMSRVWRVGDAAASVNANVYLYGNRSVDFFRYLREALIEETALPYHVFRFYGWRSMDLEPWRALVSLSALDAPEAMQRRIYELMGVKFRVGPWEPLRFDRPLPECGAVELVNEPWPRVFAVDGVRGVSDSASAKESLMSPDVDLRREVILEGEPTRPPQDDFTSEIGEITYRENLVSVLVNASGPGHVVVTDCYFPGWRAYVNGCRAPLLRANVSLRAVPIAEGVQRVVLVYRPESFLMGVWLTLCGIFAASSAGAFAAVRRLCVGRDP